MAVICTKYNSDGTVASVETKSFHRLTKAELAAWGCSDEGKESRKKKYLKMDQQYCDDSDVAMEVRQNRWGKPYWHFEIL